MKNNAIIEMVYTIGENTEKIEELKGICSSLVEIISGQQKRINWLFDIIHDLAPEYDIIETMAANEKEKQRLIRAYMNQNNNYAREAYNEGSE